MGVNLSGTIKNDLKFDTVTTTEWKEEWTFDEKFTNNANTTYVPWQLVDTLRLSKLKHNDIKYNCVPAWTPQLCGKQYKIVDVPEENILDVTISTYTDDMADPDSAVIKKLTSDVIM